MILQVQTIMKNTLRKFLGFKKHFLLIAFISLFQGLTAQTLEGYLKNSDSSAIIGALVSLSADGKMLALCQSDSLGFYKLQITVPQSTAYKMLVEIYGIEVYNELISLQENTTKNITINASNGYFLNESILIKAKQTPIESLNDKAFIKRRSDIPTAAAFGDPSRELLQEAGITISNDQSNAFSYRRIDPEYVKWSIYGAEIVNPNHLSNAGRLDDLPVNSSGGVLGIPYDAISKLQFNGHGSTIASPSSISGTADLQFDEKDYSYAQIGLLGMEAGLTTKGKINFSLIGRYSTVGLLSDLGINFDNEAIKYQDLFLKINLSDNIQLVNMIGTSINHRFPLDNSFNFRDELDLDYHSKIQIHGIHHKTKRLQNSIFYSSREDIKSVTRNGFTYVDYSINPEFNLKTQKISQSTTFDLSFNNKVHHKFLLGLNSTWHKSSGYISSFDQKEQEGYISKPFVRWTFNNHKKRNLNLQAELGHLYSNIYFQNDFEYNFQAHYALIRHKLGFQFGSRHQYPVFRLYAFGEGSFSRFDRIQTINANIQWQYWFKNDQSILLRIFGTQLDNYIDIPQIYHFELRSDKFYVYGFDLSYKAKFLGFDLQTNFTINRIYDNEYLINGAISRKVKIGSSYLHLSTATVMRFYDEYYNYQAYSRIDARLQYTFKKKNSIILDIQNVTNRINTSFQFYDLLLNRQITEEQLGLLPILSYKRQF